MKKPGRIIDVTTGQVKSGSHRTILKSNGIGSCVVVAAYDSSLKKGALAHVMLPGKAFMKNELQKTKYTIEAIDEMIKQLKHLGTNEKSIKVCLVGGGNVLKDKQSTIGNDNLVSIEDELNKRGLAISAKAVGGTERRTISLDIEKGIVMYTEGDSAEKLLWEAKIL